jgi:hypothetical protein
MAYFLVRGFEMTPKGVLEGWGGDVRGSVLLRRDLSGDQVKEMVDTHEGGMYPPSSISKLLFKNSQELACIVKIMELHYRSALTPVRDAMSFWDLLASKLHSETANSRDESFQIWVHK